MEWIINEGRVGKADPAFPWPNMRDYLIDDDGMERYQIALESCLSHATWFVESENERAVDELRDGSPECKYQSWRPKNGPYSVENFPEVEEVIQMVEANQVDANWFDITHRTAISADVAYNERTVLRFKQEPNKAEVVADFGKECYLRGLKDGVESVKHEPKEEPNPSTSFFKFVQNQHPDPDHLMSKSVESAWPEICKLADKYREEPKTGESQAEVRDTLIDFVNWFSKLKPSDKCTVHPPAGSGGSAGLYNLTNAAIVDKFLTRKQGEELTISQTP